MMGGARHNLGGLGACSPRKIHLPRSTLVQSDSILARKHL